MNFNYYQQSKNKERFILILLVLFSKFSNSPDNKGIAFGFIDSKSK